MGIDGDVTVFEYPKGSGVEGGLVAVRDGRYGSGDVDFHCFTLLNSITHTHGFDSHE